MKHCRSAFLNGGPGTARAPFLVKYAMSSALYLAGTGLMKVGREYPSDTGDGGLGIRKVVVSIKGIVGTSDGSCGIEIDLA